MAKHPSLYIQRTSMLNGINLAGRALRSAGLDPFRLDAGNIVNKAKKKAGFTGDLPRTEEGLKKLVHSINKEGRPNPFGAMAVKGLLERLLYGRYKIEQELARHPEILDSEIREPVFIIGMPRTGTTILHAMMNEDPAHRSPLAWECLLPWPVPVPESYNNNSQLNTIRKEFAQLFKLVPDFLRKHHMAADAPQECIGINALDFNSFMFSAQLYLPSYMEWFAHEADRLATMWFHKRFLQYLQSGGVIGERWLLKTPVHLMRLPEIFEVYPDARIIMTHREASNVVASTASLISSVRTLYSDYEDPVRTGHEQNDIWHLYFSRFLENRKMLQKEDHIIDLKFEDFADDQVGTVRKIYERFGWDLPKSTVTRFEQFLQSNPKGKNGVHYYHPENFGLTSEGINNRFEEYNRFLEEI